MGQITPSSDVLSDDCCVHKGCQILLTTSHKVPAQFLPDLMQESDCPEAGAPYLNDIAWREGCGGLLWVSGLWRKSVISLTEWRTARGKSPWMAILGATRQDAAGSDPSGLRYLPIPRRLFPRPAPEPKPELLHFCIFISIAHKCLILHIL